MGVPARQTTSGIYANMYLSRRAPCHREQHRLGPAPSCTLCRGVETYHTDPAAISGLGKATCLKLGSTNQKMPSSGRTVSAKHHQILNAICFVVVVQCVHATETYLTCNRRTDPERREGSQYVCTCTHVCNERGRRYPCVLSSTGD